jgi:hypothetical protein
VLLYTYQNKQAKQMNLLMTAEQQQKLDDRGDNQPSEISVDDNQINTLVESMLFEGQVLKFPTSGLKYSRDCITDEVTLHGDYSVFINDREKLIIRKQFGMVEVLSNALYATVASEIIRREIMEQNELPIEDGVAA